LKLEKNKIIRIAIDATAGAGSTSLALRLAKHYKLRYLDTGKVYRWCALQIMQNNPKNKISFLKKKIKKLSLKNLQDKKLIDDKIAQVTSHIAKNPKIRQVVFNFQKDIAYKIPKGFRGSILNGRDITYKIIPDANFKFYVTASIFERSRRRTAELKKLGKKISFNEVLKSLKKRDESDKKRKYSPLVKKHDSLLINSTRLSITGCFLKVRKIIDRKLNNYGRNYKTR